MCNDQRKRDKSDFQRNFNLEEEIKNLDIVSEIRSCRVFQLISNLTSLIY